MTTALMPPASPTVPPRARAVRTRRLPAVGMPVAGERKRGWALVSVVVHALVIALLLNHVAEAGHDGNPTEVEQGAGGKGSAGGGGGHGGTGGERVERLEYIKLAPPPPTVQPTPTVVPPPEVKPQPMPEVQQPVMPDLSKLTPQIASVIPGAGGGSGIDGTVGHGPGSGGGVGSGVGPGRGSGNGP